MISEDFYLLDDRCLVCGQRMIRRSTSYMCGNKDSAYNSNVNSFHLKVAALGGMIFDYFSVGNSVLVAYDSDPAIDQIYQLVDQSRYVTRPPVQPTKVAPAEKTLRLGTRRLTVEEKLAALLSFDKNQAFW